MQGVPGLVWSRALRSTINRVLGTENAGLPVEIDVPHTPVMWNLPSRWGIFASHWPGRRNPESGSCPAPQSRPSRQAVDCSRVEASMRTQGEIEAAVCEGITRFEQEYMGRGPKDIRTHLIGDLLVVRLDGVLTAAEQHLVRNLPKERGRDLLKQVRTHLIETARPLMESMIQDITGIKVVSLHHDISTVTGEEVLLFTLATAPAVREVRQK